MRPACGLRRDAMSIGTIILIILIIALLGGFSGWGGGPFYGTGYYGGGGPGLVLGHVPMLVLTGRIFRGWNLGNSPLGKGPANHCLATQGKKQGEQQRPDPKRTTPDSKH